MSAVRPYGHHGSPGTAASTSAGLGDLSGLDVTVIVPTYQGDAFLPECLAALASQTLGVDRFEVLVVHNGPMTASESQVQQAVAQTPGFNVRHLESPQCGVSHARNLGLDAATGTYVTFVDDDDVVGVRYLASLLEAADGGAIAVAPIGLVYDDDFSKPVFDNWMMHPLLATAGREVDITDLAYLLIHPAVAKLISRAVVGEERLDTTLAYAEDTEFWLRLVAKFQPDIALAQFVPDAAYYYRQRPGSAGQVGPDAYEHAQRSLTAIRAISRIAITDPTLIQVREKVKGTFLHPVLEYVRDHSAEIGLVHA